MTQKHTEKQLLRILTEDHENTPILLEDFQHWLLHRGYRPEEFPDAASCAVAWNLTRDYIASLKERGAL